MKIFRSGWAFTVVPEVILWKILFLTFITVLIAGSLLKSRRRELLLSAAVKKWFSAKKIQAMVQKKSMFLFWSLYLRALW